MIRMELFSPSNRIAISIPSFPCAAPTHRTCSAALGSRRAVFSRLATACRSPRTPRRFDRVAQLPAHTQRSSFDHPHAHAVAALAAMLRFGRDRLGVGIVGQAVTHHQRRAVPAQPHPALGLEPFERRRGAVFRAGHLHRIIDRLHAPAGPFEVGAQLTVGRWSFEEDVRARQHDLDQAEQSQPEQHHCGHREDQQDAEQALHLLSPPTNFSNRYRLSCGPGLASGWYCTLNAGLSVNSIPAFDPSNSDTCVSRAFAGRLSRSTAKPWFMLVISTAPSLRRLTGWLAPRWPWNIFVVRPPTAMPSSWWPRQMPNSGLPVSSSFWITGTAYSPVAAGSPGPLDRKMPSGFSAMTSS